MTDQFGQVEHHRVDAFTGDVAAGDGFAVAFVALAVAGDADNRFDSLMAGAGMAVAEPEGDLDGEYFDRSEIHRGIKERTADLR